mmetsp:Transcript_20567/g.18202  ORF Transcript_20567/g.18202 Transcript_20567/m.18202 type:complete len:109 (-) Transcript_20567:18-344(-)
MMINDVYSISAYLLLIILLFFLYGSYIDKILEVWTRGYEVLSFSLSKVFKIITFPCTFFRKPKPKQEDKEGVPSREQEINIPNIEEGTQENKVEEEITREIDNIEEQV